MKCLTCAHCRIDQGSAGWSETPGDPPSWYCGKSVWELSGFEFGRQHIEDAFALGETCDKWEDDGRQRPVAKPLVKNTPRCKHGVYTGVRCRDCENEVPLTDAELAEFSRNLNRMRAEQGYPVQDT